MPSFGTLPSPVVFTNTEGTFFLSSKEPALITSALELADVHNNLVHVLALYSERRERLTEGLAVSAVSGSYASHDFTAEQLQQMQPRLVALRGLVSTLVERREVDFAQALQVYEKLRHHCMRRFGSDFPVFEIRIPNSSGAGHLTDAVQ